MWEAAATDGDGERLLSWARSQRLDGEPQRVEYLTAPGERVLVITWWDAAYDAKVPELPDPPEELVRRRVHRWRFTSVSVRP